MRRYMGLLTMLRVCALLAYRLTFKCCRRFWPVRNLVHDCVRREPLGIVLFSAIATKLVGRAAQRRIVNTGVISLLVVAVPLTVSFLMGISLVPTLILFLPTSSAA